MAVILTNDPNLLQRGENGGRCHRVRRQIIVSRRNGAIRAMKSGMTEIGSDFDDLLKRSIATHGHLCPGQVLGVRMSMLGLSLIGISDPRCADRKALIVFVEMDRCATDAVQSVTGCSLGHRTMKFFDYGKMAATYYNLRTGKAVRVIAREDARDTAKRYFPETEDKYAAQLEAYKVMSDAELFDTQEVAVTLRPEDMPGRPLRRVCCEVCGEYVQDCRELTGSGKVLCRACADGSYYQKSGEAFSLAGVMQKGHNVMDIRSKFWISMDGEPVFGKGRMELLRAIESTGSINQAAHEVSISYRKAWGYIKAMEERLGIPLVDCRTGGKCGGGTALTREASEFLDKYRRLEDGLREVADARFRSIFGS